MIRRSLKLEADLALARNPFPSPSPLEGVLLKELVSVAKACYDRGWSHGTAGNFSLRGRNGLIWQSPTGLNKGALNPKHFIPVDLESGQVATPGTVRPSAEMPMHLAVYLTIPEAMSVVHTHPPELVAMSRSGSDLVFVGQEMQKHLGCHSHLETLKIPVITNPTPEEMPAMMHRAGSHMAPRVPMVVLATHGVYAWGKTPMEALSYIEAAEFLCKTHRQ